LVPEADARRLEARLRARILTSARAKLTRACEVIEAAAQAIGSGDGGDVPLLACALARAAALERRLLRGLDPAS
jgi:hypothetical protein